MIDLAHIRVHDVMHHGPSEPLAVSANEALDRAAQLMAEHGVAHLVVIARGIGPGPGSAAIRPARWPLGLSRNGLTRLPGRHGSPAGLP